jgi:hypothetical protein
MWIDKLAIAPPECCIRARSALSDPDLLPELRGVLPNPRQPVLLC